MPDHNNKITLNDIQFDDIGFHPERNRVYVYVIACIDTEFLKIGVSSNPRKRVQSMQTGNPFILKLAYVHPFNTSEIAFQVEARAHFLLGALNKHGEWFSANIPYVQESLEKAHKQVRNKRGDLGYRRSARSKVHLNWNYAE